MRALVVASIVIALILPRPAQAFSLKTPVKKASTTEREATERT